jgi:homoserine O-succinyltransferase
MGAKLSGVFKHKVLIPSSRLMRGFDSEFYAPHSRYTAVNPDAITAGGLELMATSQVAGVYIAATRDRKQVFVTGHSEYEMYTLDEEYRRDIAKGLDIMPPANYYENDDPDKPPVMRWRAHAHLLFANWLNYYVYQETPYNINSI